MNIGKCKSHDNMYPYIYITKRTGNTDFLRKTRKLHGTHGGENLMIFNNEASIDIH